MPQLELRDRLAELVGSGSCCNVTLVCTRGGIGEEGRLPAVAALLAAVSPVLDKGLRDAQAIGCRDVVVPISLAAGRAVVAYSCGSVPVAWRGPTSQSLAEDLARAEIALKIAGLADWWHASSQTALIETRPPKHSTVASSSSLGDEELAPKAPLLLAASGLLVTAACVWAPATQFNMDKVGYFMDDIMIRNNANVYEPLDWGRLLRTDYWGFEMFQEGQWTHKSYRPLTVLSFWMNHWLHGFDSIGFHATNVAFHAVASALLGCMGWLVLGLPIDWSVALTALFALHPIHTESVLYIVGRADVLCLILLLIAVLVYKPCVSGQLRSFPFLSSTLLLLLSTVLILAAGLSKETGFTFFGLLCGWEVLRVSTGSASVARWLRISTLIGLGVVVCAARWWYTSGTTIERMDPYSNPVAAESEQYTRSLSYALVHGLYAKLLVYPSFLCYDYSFDAVPTVVTAEDVRLLLPCGTYLAFLDGVVVSLRILLARHPRMSRGAREGPLLGLAMLLLSFLPMANILFPVGTLIGERLLYIPSAGFLILVVCLARALGLRKRGGRRNKGYLSATLVSTIGAAYAYRCARRIPEWSSAALITEVDGLRQTQSVRTQNNLAGLRLKDNRLQEAMVLFRRVVDLDPKERDSAALHHVGQLHLYHGQHAEAEAFMAKAVAGYYSPLTTKAEEIWHDYGLALWFTGNTEKAIENLENSIVVNPGFAKGYNNVACAWGLAAVLQRGVPREGLLRGIEAIQQAVAIDANNLLYWRNAAALLWFAGHEADALAAWQNAMAMRPGEDPGPFPPQDCTWEFQLR